MTYKMCVELAETAIQYRTKMGRLLTTADGIFLVRRSTLREIMEEREREISAELSVMRTSRLGCGTRTHALAYSLAQKAHTQRSCGTCQPRGFITTAITNTQHANPLIMTDCLPVPRT